MRSPPAMSPRRPPVRRRPGQRPARRRLVLRAGADRDRHKRAAGRSGEAGRGHERSQRRLRRYLPLACVVGLLIAAPAAGADSDPASDMLPTEDVYYGYGIDLRSKQAAQLPAMLATSRERGYEIKVALISGFVDLGIATWMWLDPREYARYLGDELSLVYKGRLLVLMRNGYGVYYNGAVPGKERRVISRLDPPRRAARFLDTAIDTVRDLAAANGVKLKVPGRRAAARRHRDGPGARDADGAGRDRDRGGGDRHARAGRVEVLDRVAVPRAGRAVRARRPGGDRPLALKANLNDVCELVR